jgi:ATP-dependent Clp protease ATP-binding subunit ClpC
MKLDLDQTAKDFLIDRGYNPDFGARPLRRAIGQFIEDPLAESLLSGEFTSGDLIVVVRKPEAENLFFEVKKLDAAAPTPPPSEPAAAPAKTG